MAQMMRGAEINHTDHKTVESAEDIDADLSIESRIKLLDAAKALDGVVLGQMSQWLANNKPSPFESDSDGNKSRWFTAQFIRDHSEKSYFARGVDIIDSGFALASYIDTDVSRALNPDNIRDELGHVYYSLDDTDQKYVKNVGETYFPKGQIDNLYIIEP